MRPDKCSFWFIHSFVLDNFKFKELELSLNNKKKEQRLKKPKLKEEKPFSSYVDFQSDELIYNEENESSGVWRLEINYNVTYRKKESDTFQTFNKTADALLKRSYYMEETGLCSQLLEIEIVIGSDDKLEIEDLITLSNMYERKDISFVLDGAHITPETLFNDDFNSLIDRMALGDFLEDKSKDLGPVSYNDQKKQTPYVVSVIGYNDRNDFHNKITKALETTSRKPQQVAISSENEARQLAALLYRFMTPEQWEKVDLSYVDAFSSRRGNGIENFHLHEDIFVTMHLRSTLVAYDTAATKTTSEESAFTLFDMYLPALKATLADARAKWFGYVKINHEIDQFMQEIRIKPEMMLSVVLKNILNLRKLFMALIDSTITDKRASGSLSELHKEFYRIFEVDELKQGTLLKIDLLEKVFINMQQLWFLEVKNE